MKEDLLHFIWQQRLFDQKNLLTTTGEPVEIIKTGSHNTDAGPDFTDARIKIGGTLWAGHVEIHIKSSEWKEHKHHLDPAYNNVILHVVFHDDRAKENTDLSLPVLELNKLIDISLIQKYDNLMKNRLWIPCQENLANIRKITINMFLERLVIERLEERFHAIIELVHGNNFNWHESFHQYLSKSFGFNINSETFGELACKAPLELIAKHRNDIFQIESILFGQAGLLANNFEDEYPRSLQKEYNFLQKKYDFQPMNPVSWKFARLRPGNFPTIRISQYACLIFQSENLHSKLLESNSLDEIYDLLNTRASGYWSDHYVFDKISANKSLKMLGKESINAIIINTVIPFIFVYGKEKRNNRYTEKALKFLNRIPAEKNSILDKWVKLGFRNKSASDSQALLHLKKNYCNIKKCTSCAIGTEILRLKV